MVLKRDIESGKKDKKSGQNHYVIVFWLMVIIEHPLVSLKMNVKL